MKLHLNTNTALNTVTGYDATGIEVNRQHFKHAICLWPTGEIKTWAPISFESIDASAFDGIAEKKPEVVLVGTGAKQRFLHPRVISGLATARIGAECMDTAAACRTYNILIGEGRHVVALLLPAL